MPTASVIEVVDSLVAAVKTAWNPSAPSFVERAYIAPYDFRELKWLHGRRVSFVPGSYDNSPDNRGEEAWKYDVAVRVVERYEDAGNAGERAVRDWVDERVLFVEEQLCDALDFGVLDPFLTIDSREIWTESISVLRLFDPDLLDEKKVFLSDVAFVFREVRA